MSAGFYLLVFWLPSLIRCEVPKRFAVGWHSCDAGGCLRAVHGARDQRVFTGMAFCAA